MNKYFNEDIPCASSTGTGRSRVLINDCFDGGDQNIYVDGKRTGYFMNENDQIYDLKGHTYPGKTMREFAIIFL